jgi:hypothetical protein
MCNRIHGPFWRWSRRSGGVRAAVGRVGPVVRNLLNPYLTELARSVVEEARALRCSVIIGDTDEWPEPCGRWCSPPDFRGPPRTCRRN